MSRSALQNPQEETESVFHWPQDNKDDLTEVTGHQQH